jgi:hypothetical protein
MEHTLIGRCPAGCATPLCASNDDPAGELDYLKRTSHYGSVHVLEILLQHAGWLVERTVAMDTERTRRDDFHAAIDRIIVESKQAKRHGDREDLGRYDERFAGLYISWASTSLVTAEGSQSLHGMPHVIRIESRRSPSATQSQGKDGAAHSGMSLQVGNAVWVSGQQVSFPPELLSARPGSDGP